LRYLGEKYSEKKRRRLERYVCMCACYKQYRNTNTPCVIPRQELFALDSVYSDHTCKYLSRPSTTFQGERAIKRAICVYSVPTIRLYLLFEGCEGFVRVLHHLCHRLIFDEGEVTNRSVLITIPPVVVGRGEAMDTMGGLEGGLEGGGDGNDAGERGIKLVDKATCCTVQ
jgi:hypothetical protein